MFSEKVDFLGVRVFSVSHVSCAPEKTIIEVACYALTNCSFCAFLSALGFATCSELHIILVSNFIVWRFASELLLSAIYSRSTF